MRPTAHPTNSVTPAPKNRPAEVENPNALAAFYVIPAGTLPAIANRLKMAKTCNVIAIVESSGKLFSATKEVKVTVGGCGG